MKETNSLILRIAYNDKANYKISFFLMSASIIFLSPPKKYTNIVFTSTLQTKIMLAETTERK